MQSTGCPLPLNVTFPQAGPAKCEPGSEGKTALGSPFPYPPPPLLHILVSVQIALAESVPVQGSVTRSFSLLAQNNLPFVRHRSADSAWGWELAAGELL